MGEAECKKEQKGQEEKQIKQNREEGQK